MMAVWEVEEGIVIEHDKQVAIEYRKQSEAEEARIIGEQSGTDDGQIRPTVIIS